MKKKLNEIFDEAKPQELDRFSEELDAPELTDEALASVKDKVYAKTKLKKEKKNNKGVWMRFGAVAACVVLIVSAVMVGTVLRGNGRGDVPVPGTTDDTDGVPSESREPKYEALITGFSDSSAGVNVAVEYEFVDKEKYQSIVPKKEMTIDVLGEKITATYERTSDILEEPFPRYNYHVGYAETSKDFSIDPDGNLLFYAYYDPELVGLSESECLQRAKDFVGKLTDISQYRISIEPDVVTGGKSGYDIWFRKYIGDFQTAEYATVTIADDFFVFGSRMLNKIPMDIDVSTIDMDKITKTVNEKLDKIYEERKKDGKLVCYDITPEKTYLTVLKDGSVAVMYEIAIGTVREGHEIWGDVISLVVKAE